MFILADVSKVPHLSGTAMTSNTGQRYIGIFSQPPSMPAANQLPVMLMGSKSYKAQIPVFGLLGICYHIHGAGHSIHFRCECNSTIETDGKLTLRRCVG